MPTYRVTILAAYAAPSADQVREFHHRSHDRGAWEPMTSKASSSGTLVGVQADVVGSSPVDALLRELAHYRADTEAAGLGDGLALDVEVGEASGQLTKKRHPRG